MCTYVSYLCICIVATETPDRCTLPAESGLCKAAFRRFYFNSDSGLCEQEDVEGMTITLRLLSSASKFVSIGLFCFAKARIIEVVGNICNSGS